MNAPTRDLKATLFYDGRVALYGGDCREVLRGIPDNHFDSVVTDPPYALVSIVKRFGKTALGDCTDTADRSRKGADGYARLAKGFMGKEWDNGDTAFAVGFWTEVLRVLKPGGHVAAFGGTRSYHRLACAIEDAGFEIRDQLAWVYGSGFPKSHDVSKQIDKASGAVRTPTGEIRRASIQRNGDGEEWAAGAFASHPEETKLVAITAPATDAAREWEGWGTALKPSWEPIALARKPLSEGTVAANVLRWGTGAINVDGCRVRVADGDERTGGFGQGKRPWQTGDVGGNTVRVGSDTGRWPANLIHDGSPEVLAGFPDSAGQNGLVEGGTSARSVFNPNDKPRSRHEPRNDSGSAARFFYSAKADSDDRIGSKHPTVKPVALMRWLVRLLTPPGGVVLDPFAGTGTTAEAALLENFRSVMIEREAEYQADIARRMAHVFAPKRERRAVIVNAKGKISADTPLFQSLSMDSGQ